MAGEIVISDTIQARLVMAGIYDVTASVMGASDTRDLSKSVTVRWNSTEGSTACKNRLIAAYQALVTPPETDVLTQLKTDIGTDVANTPQTQEPTITINATSVNVISGGT